jgi:hypothetical protein
MLTSTKERSALWDSTEFGGWFSTSETKLHRLYDSNDTYELQFQSSNTMDVQKITYHVVLEWPTLWLYGALSCHFIVLVDNLIVTIGVSSWAMSSSM